MARCSYRYPLSGDQCVYTGCKEEGDQCPAHVYVSGQERAAQKAADKVEARAAKKVAVKAAESVRPPRPERAEIVRPPPPPEPVVPMPPPPPVVREPPPIGAPGDPSAPYCTCANRTADPQPCTSCGKPHYMDWRLEVGARIKARSL